MKPFLKKFWLKFSLTLLLVFVQQFSFAAASIAYSKDSGYTYTVYAYDDIKIANQEALDGCSKKAQECVLELNPINGPTTIAIAKGEGGASFVTNSNPRKAYDEALALCKKSHKKCAVKAVYWEPGIKWGSWATFKDASGDLQNSHLYTKADSQEEAEEAALSRCNAKSNNNPKEECEINISFKGYGAYVVAESSTSKGFAIKSTLKEAKETALTFCRTNASASECKITKIVENPGPAPEPSNFRAVYLMTGEGKQEIKRAKAPQNPPTVRSQSRQSNHVSCTNNCVNGSCIRTFPDGRKEKWQAPHVYDAISGDWKWETSSCGN